MRSLFIISVAVVLMAQSAVAQSCVTNASAHSYFFAVTPKTGERFTQDLAPGMSLCSPTKTGATLSVYETKHALEGCSRLVAPSRNDSLIAYAEFDRCEWGSHAP